MPPRWCGGCSPGSSWDGRSEEHTSELQSLTNLVCRLLLEKKKEQQTFSRTINSPAALLRPMQPPVEEQHEADWQRRTGAPERGVLQDNVAQQADIFRPLSA